MEKHIARLNERELILVSLQELPYFIETNDNNPFAILLVAEKENDIHVFIPIIEELINKGCIYFVCAGRKSESLHDIIDEIIVMTTLDDKEVEDDLTIITTWHTNDTLDDISFFFQSCTNPDSITTLVAVLDDKVEFCCKIKKLLI